MSFEGLGQIGWEAVNTVATLLVAAVGGLIGWYVGRSGRVQARFVALTEYRREIIAFATDAIATIDRAAALARVDPADCPDFRERRNQFTAELSTLIDRGRFFFPDIAPDAFGTADAPPGSGIRDAVLNRLIAAHFAVRALNWRVSALNRHGAPILQLRDWGETRKAGREACDALFAADPQRLQLLRAWDHLAAEHRQELKAREWVWSCEQALVQAKRGFVTEIWPLTAPGTWNALVQSVHNAPFARREETPGA